MDKYVITACYTFKFVRAYILFFSSRRFRWDLCCKRAGGYGIADDPMGTSSFIIPARLYNAWEILTVITAASQGFLPRPTGFRDSANYGSGMDLQCLIYYSGWGEEEGQD